MIALIKLKNIGKGGSEISGHGEEHDNNLKEDVTQEREEFMAWEQIILAENEQDEGGNDSDKETENDKEEEIVGDGER